MKRTLALLSALALLLSVMVLPAMAGPHEDNPGGNCDPTIDGFGFKLDIEDDTVEPGDDKIAVGDTFWIEGVPGNDGELYDVEVTVVGAQELAFVVYEAGTDDEVDADVVFCVKGSNTNTGTITDTSFDNSEDGPQILTPSNNPADISNFVVYGVVIDPGTGDEEIECWEGETAWADGSRYVARGNWATYTHYQSVDPVTIFAGQTNAVGTASFSEVTDDGKVTITIVLEDDVRLAIDPDTEDTVVEAVKIQGYGSAPSGNPTPGLFTTYKGNELMVTVDAYDYYGIHLDVEVLVDCPVEIEPDSVE